MLLVGQTRAASIWSSRLRRNGELRLASARRPDLQGTAAAPPPDMSSSAIATPARPVHVARDQHPISRKDISPNALRVLYSLREGGFASYLVGDRKSTRLNSSH